MYEQAIKNAEEFLKNNPIKFKRTVKEGGTKKQKQFATDIYNTYVLYLMALSFARHNDIEKTLELKDRTLAGLRRFDGHAKDVIEYLKDKYYEFANVPIENFLNKELEK